MKEREIRPKKIHQTIISLSEKDTKRFLLPHKKKFVKIPCPACGSQQSTLAFEKFRMPYMCCVKCASIFQSPRPSEALLSKHYNSMQSVSYWETGFYKKTVEARRTHMFAPRSSAVVKAAQKFLPKKTKNSTLIDVGSGYGVFLEEVKKRNYFSRIIAIEPTKKLAAECAAKGFPVIEKWVNSRNVKSLPERAHVLTCFEVLEHVFDPLAFLNTFSSLILPNGLFILSFPSASGLDVQALQEKSNTIYPPHHINIMTVEGVRALVKRTKNLEIVDLTTPGKLDVDIAFNALREKKTKTLGGFLDYIYMRQDEELNADLQAFCRDHLLSSHIFLILKKV